MTVLGGAEDEPNLFPAVVVVGAACSGTLIAADAVLTAAHCVCPAVIPGTVWPAADAGTCEERVAVSFEDRRSQQRVTRLGSVVVHPDYRQQRDDAGALLATVADIALVRLDGRACDLAEPLELGEPPELGDPVTLVGYGRRACDAPGFGLRFYGSNTVASLTGDVVCVDGRNDDAGALTWLGDSGGAYLSAESKVVGVVSYGGCTGGLRSSACATNISEYRTWILSELCGPAPHGASR